ncbi:hypothetical protein V6N12_041745 [Hibiscus sabdariffa]|uniref:Uncharacterized protein n=1 Tax=Hibiscus sabdariffa TaxID=183260 RepID=A0ABR2B3Q2_9ROSI
MLEERWGIAGLVIGLRSSIVAIYRADAYDVVVIKVKELIVSWIPHMSSSVQTFDSSNKRLEILLSVGPCLALPHLVAFCQRVEMVDGNELHHLINGNVELISDNKFGSFHKSLLTVSYILSEGLHFIEMFRKCYSSPYPPIVHLGGMLEIDNAFGAGGGNLVDFQPFNPSVHTGYDQKDHSHISGLILVNPVCEEHSTSLMQEILLVAQNSDDNHLQQYVTVAIVRCCMRYEAQVTRLSAPDMALKERTLREECLQFALVYGYAKQFDAPLTFLDELFDLSRFTALELSL